MHHCPAVIRVSLAVVTGIFKFKFKLTRISIIANLNVAVTICEGQADAAADNLNATVAP